MAVWILFAVAWSLAALWLANQQEQFFRDRGEGDGSVAILLLVAIPPLFGIGFALRHARQPGRALKPWVAGLLAFLGFVVLSAAPFALAELGADWYESGWTLVVLAAMSGLSMALRKRNPLAADSLKELAFAGFAGWGVVLLWLQAASLFGTFV